METRENNKEKTPMTVVFLQFIYAKPPCSEELLGAADRRYLS
jgi:hypothetical protein